MDNLSYAHHHDPIFSLLAKRIHSTQVIWLLRPIADAHPRIMLFLCFNAFSRRDGFWGGWKDDRSPEGKWPFLMSYLSVASWGFFLNFLLFILIVEASVRHTLQQSLANSFFLCLHLSFCLGLSFFIVMAPHSNCPTSCD